MGGGGHNVQGPHPKVGPPRDPGHWAFVLVPGIPGEAPVYPCSQDNDKVETYDRAWSHRPCHSLGHRLLQACSLQDGRWRNDITMCCLHWAADFKKGLNHSTPHRIVVRGVEGLLFSGEERCICCRSAPFTWIVFLVQWLCPFILEISRSPSSKTWVDHTLMAYPRDTVCYKCLVP